MMTVGGHEDVRRRAAAPGGGEDRIAWIAGTSNITPVILPGHDHHDVGPPTTGRVGAPEPAVRTSPLPHEPIAPPADSRRSPPSHLSHHGEGDPHCAPPC